MITGDILLSNLLKALLRFLKLGRKHFMGLGFPRFGTSPSTDESQGHEFNNLGPKVCVTPKLMAAIGYAFLLALRPLEFETTVLEGHGTKSQTANR